MFLWTMKISQVEQSALETEKRNNNKEKEEQQLCHSGTPKEDKIERGKRINKITDNIFLLCVSMSILNLLC